MALTKEQLEAIGLRIQAVDLSKLGIAEPAYVRQLDALQEMRRGATAKDASDDEKLSHQCCFIAECLCDENGNLLLDVSNGAVDILRKRPGPLLRELLRAAADVNYGIETKADEDKPGN